MNILVKVLLLCAVFFSSVSVALYSSLEYTKRLKFHEGLLRLLEYTVGSIRYRRIPLTDIFDSFENSFLEEYGFLPELRKCKSLEITVIKYLKKAGTKKSVCDTLKQFAASLGTKCAEEEIAAAEFVCEILRKECSELENALYNKRYFNIKIGICIGLMLVTILL